MKIIIIGAGIAGLASGIYAQKNGIESIIYEKNTYVGGNLVYPNNKKENLSIVPWMACGKENIELFQVWNEFIPQDNFFIPPFFFKYQDENNTFTFWQDKNKTKEEWLSKSPNDTKQIHSFFSTISDLEDYVENANIPWDLMNPFLTTKKQLKQRKINKIISKYENITVEEYFSSFSDKSIKNAFLSIFNHNESIITLLLTIANYLSGKLVQPKKGINDILEQLKNIYISMGGKIIFQETLEEIKWANPNSCEKVIFKSGKYDYADEYILAIDRKFYLRYENKEAYPVYSGIHFSYYVDFLKLYKKNNNYQEGIYIYSCEPIKIGKNYYSQIILHIIPSLNEVYCTFKQDIKDYEYWESLYQTDFLYNKKLKEICDEVKSIIENIFPEWKKIQLKEVITPIDYFKLTNTYKGSIYSFHITPQGKPIYHNGNINMTNVYIASQWMNSPGGIDQAFLSGKFIIQRIIESYRKGKKL